MIFGGPAEERLWPAQLVNRQPVTTVITDWSRHNHEPSILTITLAIGKMTGLQTRYSDGIADVHQQHTVHNNKGPAGRNRRITRPRVNDTAPRRCPDAAECLKISAAKAAVRGRWFLRRTASSRSIWYRNSINCRAQRPGSRPKISEENPAA